MDGGDISVAPNVDRTGGDTSKHGQSRPLITVGERRALSSAEFNLAEQIGATAVRLRGLIGDSAAGVLHVTSASGGEGVSTVTRELAHATGRMQWCRTLLLDAHPGRRDQAHALGGALPDLIEGYAARGTIEVVALETSGGAFHAARWETDGYSAGTAVVPIIGCLLRAAYDLILLDCPPILSHPHLPAVSGGAPRVLMVVRSGQSSLRSVQRGQREIEALNGTVWGAILTGDRASVVPRR